MENRINKSGLSISHSLYEFIENKALPNTNIGSDSFWYGFSSIIHELNPINSSLLKKRDELQNKLDDWHKTNSYDPSSLKEYKQFLKDIDYLVEDGDDFSVDTTNVDPEIKDISGPQLVVPINNERYAINAANARWGSLYDALYGSNAIPESNGAEKQKVYNPIRGEKVINWAKSFLDDAIPLSQGNFQRVTSFSIINNRLAVQLDTGVTTYLKNDIQFSGYTGSELTPSKLLFNNNGLHIEIIIDSKGVIGKLDLANIQDIFLESAITTIQDCEDSVAAVDVEDKVKAYENWLGLMQGNLSAVITKGEDKNVRTLASDRTYKKANGSELVLSGRSLLLVRNVGLLMQSHAITDKDGRPIYEGIMDAVITSLIALHDLNDSGQFKNSKAGSIYIVKPKMHGPEEVAFSHLLFGKVEELLKLPSNTIKMGIMDEERRTTINLKESIRAAKDRVFFINTGFLDRTGDEIHSSMEAGPFVPKSTMKDQSWIKAYEQWNVDIGIKTGLIGKAQIGKGMWAKPDEMEQMLNEKVGHPLAGASCAWVPSPTAATLHATHYHKVNVKDVQNKLSSRQQANLDDILTLPLLKENLTTVQIQEELNNNIQGILGYVVRWIDHGVGCSKVPDIHNVGLMEDRATLRISSQYIANWLHHGICTKQQVEDSLQKMAAVVDQQNTNDSEYQAMTLNLSENIAYKAACDLVFKGRAQPNGYTEPLLHHYRSVYKTT